MAPRSREVRTDQAPQPVGTYSQAVVHGRWVFVAGQLPFDPSTGELVAGGIEEQTERVLENVAAILVAAGSSLERVVRTGIFVTDLSHFAGMNDVYARFFRTGPKPARTTVQVAALPAGALIELDAIATHEETP